MPTFYLDVQLQTDIIIYTEEGCDSSAQLQMNATSQITQNSVTV